MEKVQELINIAEQKTDLDERYSDDEWGEIRKLSDETFKEYQLKLSGGAYVRFEIEIEKRCYENVKVLYESGKIDFNAVKQRIDNYHKEIIHIDDFCSLRFEKEKKYGYSWSFLYVCNRHLGISLRKLETETGIKKDVLSEYLNKLERGWKLETEVLELRNALEEKENALKKIKL